MIEEKKIIRTYDDGYGYGIFEFNDGTSKRFPLYWMLSSWTTANEHEEVQKLLKQVIVETVICSDCKGSHQMIFPPKDKYICIGCQIARTLDAEIFSALSTCKKC